jgi:hypothetical protein
MSLINVNVVVSQTFIKLQGQVTDEAGKALPYVSIFLSLSKKGTITNDEGNFSLTFDKESDVLRASSIGYETFSTKIDSNTKTLNIKLKQSSTQLNEVIVSNLTAAELLKKALEKIPENYEQTPFLIKSYSRVKSYENDSLLYFEETAIDIISSYKSGFQDELFLTKNRNLQIDKKVRGIRRQRDYDAFIKNAKQILDKDFFNRYNLSYQPATTFDNRMVYVIFAISKKKEDNTVKFYIDTEDLAFVKIDSEREDGELSSSQYKKIDGKYFFISGHFVHINKYMNRIVPVESDYITTEIIRDFTKENLVGIPFNRGDILKDYMVQTQDTVFWKEYNAILPDSVTAIALEKYENTQKTETQLDSLEYAAKIKRLYMPNVSLMFSSDWTRDFAALNYNSVSISHLVNNCFITTIGKKDLIYHVWASTAYYILSVPFEDVLTENFFLNISGINAKINPFAYNKYGISYLYNINDNLMIEYKQSDYQNFMRLHTIRNDGHYAKSQILEEELVRADLSNSNNKLQCVLYYIMELGYHRSLNMYNPFANEVKSQNWETEKQPLLIDRNRSWVKSLFEPETAYQRHVKQADLTEEETNYIKRSAWFSWLNLLSPQMLAIKKFKINKNNSFTFIVDYLRVPFGEMFGQHIWLMHNYSHLHGVFLKQYRNYGKTTLGIGYKLYDFKLLRNAFVTTTLDYWQQPLELQFKDNSFANGFHVGQIFECQFLPNKYKNVNNLSLFVGYDYKTKGYLPQSYFLEKNFDIKVGFKYNL